MEGKRKREIELKGMGNEDNGMEGMGEEKKKEEEEEENGMLGVGKKLRKAKKKEGKPNKGSGGGILTNKLFSELEISEHTAKAIGQMKYTHLTEVRTALLHLKFTSYIIFICSLQVLCSHCQPKHALHTVKCFCKQWLRSHLLPLTRCWILVHGFSMIADSS